MNTIILCNGKPPDNTLFSQCLDWADYFIAADGGGNVARLLGEPPDVVIGDLDSYKPADSSEIEVIHDPDQYSNDLEKALELAIKKEATTVKVLGATGLRLDHTLKNLSVMKQYNAQFKQLLFLDNHVTIKLLPDNFVEDIPIDASVSLFPLSGRVSGVTIRGLKYELTDDVLENGVQDGTSNTVVANPVNIKHKEGDLLLFIKRNDDG